MARSRSSCSHFIKRNRHNNDDEIEVVEWTPQWKQVKKKDPNNSVDPANQLSRREVTTTIGPGQPRTQDKERISSLSRQRLSSVLNYWLRLIITAVISIALNIKRPVSILLKIAFYFLSLQACCHTSCIFSYSFCTSLAVPTLLAVRSTLPARKWPSMWVPSR